MRKIFRKNELLLLYLIGFIYTILFGLRIQRDNNINLQYIFFEVAFFILILYLIREFIIFFRLQKLNGKLVFGYSKMIFIFRVFIVLLYYLSLLFLDYEISKIMILLIGVILNVFLPRPVSERFYITDKGYVLNGTYFENRDIKKLNLLKSGSLDIIFNKKEIRVTNHSKKQRIMIYEYLQN